MRFLPLVLLPLLASAFTPRAPPLATRSLTLKTTWTDVNDVEETIHEALYVARTGRGGPVVIDIPKDIQNSEIAFKGHGSLPLHGYRRRLARVEENVLGDGASERFFTMLSESNRPLIYAGGGVINANATKAMRRLASEYGIPVTTTLMALGASDTTHPLALHMLGMHGIASANYAVEDCDFLIAVGARFDDRVAGNPGQFAPNAKNIAHFDVDFAEIGKVKRVNWHHVGVLERDHRHAGLRAAHSFCQDVRRVA